MTETTRPSLEELDEASQLVGRMKSEISKAIIGQDSVIDQVLVGLFSAGHVLLEGVPGLGKTLLVKALAKTFAGSFSRNPIGYHGSRDVRPAKWEVSDSTRPGVLESSSRR